MGGLVSIEVEEEGEGVGLFRVSEVFDWLVWEVENVGESEI